METELLRRLSGSADLGCIDGGAVPGIQRGVILVKKGAILGVWSYDFRGFTYWPISGEGSAHVVKSIDEVVRVSINIVLSENHLTS